MVHCDDVNKLTVRAVGTVYMDTLKVTALPPHLLGLNKDFIIMLSIYMNNLPGLFNNLGMINLAVF